MDDMDHVKLLLKSEISNIVYKTKAVIKDYEAETAAVCQAIEEVLVLLPKSDGKSSSAIVCSHYEQACTIYVNEYYVSLGEFFIENFNVKWLHSDNDTSSHRVILLFDRYFVSGPDEESFILLCHAISVLRLHVVRIHCLELLEDLLKKNCIMKILERYCCGQVVKIVQRQGLSDSELAQLPQWQTLVCAICSLPDVTASKVSSLEPGTFFLPQNYVPLIGSEVLAVMRLVYTRLQNDLDSSVLFLALLAGKISLCGYGELLLRSLVAELQHLCVMDFLWRRIAQRFFGGIPDRCLESIVVQLVVLVSSPNVLDAFLSNMPQTSPKLAYILSHKLLLVRCFDGPTAVRVLRNIVGYLAGNTELSVLFASTFRSVLATWADGSSLRHRPLEQSLYLSKAVVAFVAYASPQAITDSREDILQHLLDGLPNYLGSSITAVRQIGSVVAEKLSCAVHKDSDTEPLHLDVEKDEMVESILELCNIPSSVVNTSLNSNEKTSEKESEFVAETLNNMSLKQEDEKQQETSARKCKEDLDSDDEENDELKPYTAFANEPENAKRPVYLAQCIDGLIKQDDPESVEQSLIHVEALIRQASLSTVREVGVELCRILLHLDDQFALASFMLLRFRSMVSLAVTVPAVVAEYLGTEFYARNYNIRQRMDILDVLAAAATELAEPPKTTPGSSAADKQSSLSLMSESASQHADWREVVRERIDAKTRHFGKGRQCPPSASTANRFASVAGLFFYPLLWHFDRPSDPCLDLLGSDHLVLKRLIYTLGVVMMAATGTPAAGRMSTVLLEFIRCCRHHVEAGVRGASLYAVCASLASMPSTAVLDDPAAFTDLGDWLQNVLRQDADAECRHRATQALQLLNAAVKQINE